MAHVAGSNPTLAKVGASLWISSESNLNSKWN
jgi:hypothetical protein